LELSLGHPVRIPYSYSKGSTMTTATIRKASKASTTSKAPKASKVDSSLDLASPVLVESGRALIGQSIELESTWFSDSVELLHAGKISVRGIQCSMADALLDSKGKAQEGVTFPSLTSTMVQYFLQASALMGLDGWKGSPVQAIRLIQSGKRSQAFKSAKEFDGALATAKTATTITKKASQPKRASKVTPKMDSKVNPIIEGEKKVATFGDSVSILLSIAKNRTSHALTEIQLGEARILMAVLNKAIKAQEVKGEVKISA
jgi:hypothetical protein